MIKAFTYLIQSILIYVLFIIGKLLGINLSRKLFSKIFLKFASKFRSKVIIEKNLEIFSKDLEKEKKDEIISNMWKNYGKTFIEYIFLNQFKKNIINIEVEGKENLKKILENKKPVIFISGHFANYELMSMEIVKSNIKLATIYRPLNNYFLNPMMEFLRRKYVCKNQIKKGVSGVREAMEYLKKNYSIALMIDQRVSEGERVNFFGKPALTTTLPAQLAIKFDLSIVPVFIERRENDQFKIKFYSEIIARKYDNKFQLTEKLNNLLEDMILYKPDQWIWSHNRWK